MLTTFFGWKGASSSPVAESSPTTISDRSHSPLPSPRVPPSPLSFPSSIKSIPHMIDITKANGAQRSSFFGTKGMPAAPPTPSILARVEELEEELREISAELAGSIRREMELEDQVERLQLEVPPAQAPAPSRRTSDYFSDSGTSSVRYQNSEGDGGKVEDLEKQMRKSDQEKAQLKVDLSQKLQEERGRRTTMEAHIKSLEDHIYNVCDAPCHGLGSRLILILDGTEPGNDGKCSGQNTGTGNWSRRQSPADVGRATPERELRRFTQSVTGRGSSEPERKRQSPGRSSATTPSTCRGLGGGSCGVSEAGI